MAWRWAFHLGFASDKEIKKKSLARVALIESADHALFKMVRYVLLRPLRPELDAKTKTCLAEGELSSRLDEQAIRVLEYGYLAFLVFLVSFIMLIFMMH
jgi:hypothetical protein